MSVLALLLPLLVPSGPANGSAEVTLQVRAKEIHLGDGTRVEDGVLVVEEGRVARVGRGVEVDSRRPLLVHDGVLTPGIVALSAQTGAAGEAHDATRSILLEARLAHAYDPDVSGFEDARRAGITTIVIAPSAENVVGGLTCVVKATGEPLAREGHLALALTRRALEGAQQQRGGFGFFGGGGRDGSGDRFPTSYPGAVRAIEEHLERGEGPFAAAAKGELPVLVEAWERHEVVRAAELARRAGLRGAVRGAPLAGELADVLARSGLGVVLGPFDAGHEERALAALPALADAGVPFAFALGEDAHPEQVRLSAAMAARAGVDPEVLRRALFADAARLAGVERRVGKLEPGADADFVLWSGDPLDLASRALAVYVEGVKVAGGER